MLEGKGKVAGQSNRRRKTERLTEGGRENQEWGAAEVDRKKKKEQAARRTT